MISIKYVIISNEYTRDRRILSKLQHDIGNQLSLTVPSELYTNISHSYNLVVCAISDNPIGIDIELKKKLNIEDFDRNIFPDFIWNNINLSMDTSNAFLKYWTNLESALKASRFGFNISFDEIIWDSNIEFICIKNRKWFVKTININKRFLCSISSNYEITKFETNKIHLK